MERGETALGKGGAEQEGELNMAGGGYLHMSSGTLRRTLNELNLSSDQESIGTGKERRDCESSGLHRANLQEEEVALSLLVSLCLCARGQASSDWMQWFSDNPRTRQQPYCSPTVG